MANTVKLKRSSVAGKVPTTSDLQLGELALNTYDGKLFTKKDDGTASIVELSGGGGGGSGAYTISSTPPSSPASGDMWFDLDTGAEFSYINDGDSSQWVEAAPPVVGGGGGTVDIDPVIAGMIF